MFKPFDKKTTLINESTYLKFVDVDAPFYSKLELYNNQGLISDCSFKSQEKDLIKNSMHNIDSLMNSLTTLNSQINNVYLKEFIELLQSHRENVTVPIHRP